MQSEDFFRWNLILSVQVHRLFCPRCSIQNAQGELLWSVIVNMYANNCFYNLLCNYNAKVNETPQAAFALVEDI